MRAVAVAIAGRTGLAVFVDRTQTGLIALGEESCSDKLAVASFGGIEVFRRHALAIPSGGDGTKPRVIEALPLWPDAGIENTDHDVSGVVGLRNRAALRSSPRETRGTGRVEFVADVRKDSHDAVLAGEGTRLGRGEFGREPVGYSIVGVEELSGVRNGAERGIIPVRMFGEVGRHLRLSHVDDIRCWHGRRQAGGEDEDDQEDGVEHDG
ncbi:hypothetical protein HPP92_017759 [Vanilla planifolia]|uniref:Uncharacterized protein n=1 Tax=Vanilla planifolia TaxID=51239 RepID=A0A835UK67_VANPL|nr:hypothetical protein HPP92_017759 [Vanilla planifolia]